MDTVAEDELGHQAQEAARLLVAAAAGKGATVATAESLTAGLVASCIASVPGASAILKGGAATYCDEAKHGVLGVRRETLAAHGAVSSQTACEMADGARVLFGADVAVSLTGYAGPGGGTDAEPTGTVYLAVSAQDGTTWRRITCTGTRNEVRAKAARIAIEMLLAAL